MTSIRLTEKIKAAFMLSFIVLFLINSFIPEKLWTALMAPIVVATCIMAFPFVKGTINKYLSCLMVIIGIFLLIKSGAALNTWTEAFTKNAGITVLLLSVPLLSSIFYFEDFHYHISNFAIKHIKSDLHFYIFTVFLTNLLGIILNAASVPLVNTLLKEISIKHPKKVFYKALIRGYCLGQLWAPNFVTVALALQYSGLQWYQFAPLGFVLSVTGIILAVFLGKVGSGNRSKQPVDMIPNDAQNSESNIGSILRILTIAIFLISFVISLQIFTGKSVMVIVPFVSVIFPAVLAVLMKKLSIFKAKFSDYYSTILPKMNNEIILFTSVGFLGHAMSFSGVDKYIPLIINSLNIKSPIILVPFIVIVIVTLSFIGLHPVLTISTIGIAFSSGTLPLSQVQMAAAFALSYFTYTLISPFSGIVLAIAGFDHEDPFNVGIKTNFIFAVLIIGLSAVITALW